MLVPLTLGGREIRARQPRVQAAVTLLQPALFCPRSAPLLGDYEFSEKKKETSSGRFAMFRIAAGLQLRPTLGLSDKKPTFHDKKQTFTARELDVMSDFDSPFYRSHFFGGRASRRNCAGIADREKEQMHSGDFVACIHTA